MGRSGRQSKDYFQYFSTVAIFLPLWLPLPGATRKEAALFSSKK
jgi:hypothetical protein